MLPPTSRSGRLPVIVRRLLLVVAIALVASAATGGLTPSAEAAAGSGRLTATAQGQDLRVEGSGFPASARGWVMFRSGTGASTTERVTTTASGTFSVTLDGAADIAAVVSARVGTTDAELQVATTVPEPQPVPEPAPPSPSAPTYGPDPSYRPDYDVLVPVGGLTQALLDSKPEGTRFALAAGTHRLTAPLRPKRNQQLLGMPGAVIDGSKVLTGWKKDGSRWYVGGQTQDLPGAVAPAGYDLCMPNRPLCNDPDDVFLDGRLLTQVATLADLRSGTYFFDTAADRIYLADDPTGRLVEATVAPAAFRAPGVTGVVLRNLVIQKFGNPAQTGAVEGTGWTIERSTIRLNHGVGVIMSGGVLRDSSISSNGQAGPGGGGQGLLVEHNEIAHNNTQGHNPWFSAGGVKWSFARDLVVRNNWVHHNLGAGMVTDINNVNVLYEGNTVEDNGHAGIVHEISYDAVIRDNVIRRNGTDPSTTWFTERVGIAVVNSRNVEVYGNTLTDNAGGGVLGVQDSRISHPDNDKALGPWQLVNLSVHHNTTRLIGNGGWGGNHVGLDIHPQVPDRASYYTAKNNRFFANTYQFPAGVGGNGQWFFWTDGGTGHKALTYSAWTGLGMQ